MRFGTQTAQNAIAVTPDDDENLDGGVCRALYVGTSGDVALIPAGSGTSVIFVAVPVGILPVSATRVLATGTDADDIVALY